MRTVFKGFVAAAVIAGSSLAVAAPAEARYHHGNGNNALVAGIVGLGVGAAIASSDRGYYGGSGGGYYGYDSGPAYYAPAPVAYYGVDYYGGGYGYDNYYGGRGYDRRDYGRGHRDWDRRGRDDDRGHRGHDRDDRGNHDRGNRDYRR